MASKKKDKKKDQKDKSSDKNKRDKLIVEKSNEEIPNVPLVYFDPAIVNDVNLFQGSEQHFPDSHQTDVVINDTQKESRQIDLQTVTEIQVLLKELLSLFEKLEDQFR